MGVARLPSEIFAAICDLVPLRDLSKIMLVNKHCRQFAERILYSSIHLDFFENENRLRSTQCLQTLSVSKSAVVALRQLSVYGLALAEPAVHTLLTTTLYLAVNISSLDIVFLDTPDSPPFPDALARSPQFLPQLSAINTDEPRAVVQLAPGRPCASVRVQETIGEDILGHLIDALSRAAPTKQLQLKVATSGPQAIVPSVRRIARSFNSLTTLGIQFVLPSPTLTWEALADFLCIMAASLSPITTLRIVSLVTLPDPVLPPRDIQDITRRAAEVIVQDHLPQLHRIEIRWNGWFTPAAAGDWIPVPQERLLRRTWHV